MLKHKLCQNPAGRLQCSYVCTVNPHKGSLWLGFRLIGICFVLALKKSVIQLLGMIVFSLGLRQSYPEWCKTCSTFIMARGIRNQFKPKNSFFCVCVQRKYLMYCYYFQYLLILTILISYVLVLGSLDVVTMNPRGSRRARWLPRHLQWGRSSTRTQRRSCHSVCTQCHMTGQ